MDDRNPAGNPFVQAFASDSPAYREAFQAFLDHTDQKTNAFAWLSAEIARLPRRHTLIDAGAGNGQLTARLAPQFEKVIAIEPNPSLVQELRVACPSAEIIERTITQGFPSSQADFIICSHILYYIPRAEWLINTQRLTGWLHPGGVLAIAIQNPQTDCMQMVRHFIGGELDGLAQLQAEFSSQSTPDFEARFETVTAHIETTDLETACRIAEFILNVQPMQHPPRWEDLKNYVADQFRQPTGGYRFSCHQDFLRIVRR
ncbi:MAG: class I SAM-dependent methyltransferase [Planctomycetales bacterium]